MQGDEDFACRQGLLVLVRVVTYRCFSFRVESALHGKQVYGLVQDHR